MPSILQRALDRQDAARAILKAAERPLTAREVHEQMLADGWLSDVDEPERVARYTMKRLVERGYAVAVRKHPLRTDVHGNALVYDYALPF